MVRVRAKMVFLGGLKVMITKVMIRIGILPRMVKMMVREMERRLIGF